jgi:hypothetical protein
MIDCFLANHGSGRLDRCRRLPRRSHSTPQFLCFLGMADRAEGDEIRHLVCSTLSNSQNVVAFGEESLVDSATATFSACVSVATEYGLANQFPVNLQTGRRHAIIRAPVAPAFRNRIATETTDARSFRAGCIRKRLPHLREPGFRHAGFLHSRCRTPVNCERRRIPQQIPFNRSIEAPDADC